MLQRKYRFSTFKLAPKIYLQSEDAIDKGTFCVSNDCIIHIVLLGLLNKELPLFSTNRREIPFFHCSSSSFKALHHCFYIKFIFHAISIEQVATSLQNRLIHWFENQTLES